MIKLKSILLSILLCLVLCTCTACYAKPDKYAPAGEKCQDGLWVCQEVDLTLTNEWTGMLNMEGEELEFCYMYDGAARIIFYIEKEDYSGDDSYTPADQERFCASLSKCKKKEFVIYKTNVITDEYGLFDNTDQLTFILEESE